MDDDRRCARHPISRGRHSRCRRASQRASKTTDALCYGLSAPVNTLRTQAPVDHSTHLHASPNTYTTVRTRPSRSTPAFDDLEPRPGDVSGGAARYNEDVPLVFIWSATCQRAPRAGGCGLTMLCDHTTRPRRAGCEISQKAPRAHRRQDGFWKEGA